MWGKVCEMHIYEIGKWEKRFTRSKNRGLENGGNCFQDAPIRDWKMWKKVREMHNMGCGK